MEPTNAIEKNHQSHESHWDNYLFQKEARLFTLRNEDCVSYKVSEIVLNLFNPFFHGNPTWLTIGDYNGFEASFLNKRGVSATASDISDVFLKESHKEGLIQEYAKINVEAIDFPSDHFDYVSCKEAFHHFPRPYVGLYEMIRVARKGVMLIEPLDVLSAIPLLLFLKGICDKINPLLINKIWKNRFSWESVGNYVYKVSERELEKVAMGISLPCIAFKGLNVLRNEPLCGNIEVPHNRKVMSKINEKLWRLELLSKLHLLPHNSLCALLFKTMPEESIIRQMKEMGYRILPLPKNPYL